MIIKQAAGQRYFASRRGIGINGGEHHLQTHAKAKFDLLVLPELFACGYNIGDAVNGRAGGRANAIFCMPFNMGLPNVMA